MNSQSGSLRVYGLILLAVFGLAGLGWANYRYASRSAGGGSFLVFWVGTRALITEGASPYSEEVAQSIRQALQDRSEHFPQFSRVTYPLYTFLLFLPFALVQDPVLSLALWMMMLEIFLALFAIACVKLTRWRMNAWNTPLYVIFTCTWFHSLIVLHDGHIALLVAPLLAWAFLAIRNGQDELAGGLLALSTIHPILVLVSLAFVLLWAISQKRWKLVVWFLGSLLLLILGSMFFLQDWLLQYIRAIFASLKPSYPMSPGAAFTVWWPGVGSRLGWVLTALLTAILSAEWWMTMRTQEFRWFLWTASLTLVLGQWIGLRTRPENYLLLLIPLTLVFAVWDERWRRNERQARAVIATVISMILLELGLWGIYWNATRHGLALYQMSELLFPLPLFLIITLYWVRWWAIRPQRLYVEALRESEIMSG